MIELFNENAFACSKLTTKKFSINPILHSFQAVVNQYTIDHELIESFLKSMEMDLYHNEYDKGGFQQYVYGSAEVVGLMCLQVFTCEKGNYMELVHYARKLGEAFQKINFLRDLKDDYLGRGRSYFPQVDNPVAGSVFYPAGHCISRSCLHARRLPVWTGIHCHSAGDRSA
ncbi:MAG: squalene/phytoene synthase family protein [Bacteroidales bacterium]|nr:squalene/phytoene synthase family protein [Bacteroidales bacterium]